MFVSVKKVGTYRHLQIAENRREGKRVKQTIIATLGRLGRCWASSMTRKGSRLASHTRRVISARMAR